MSYVKTVLQPSETLLCTTRLHWFIYLPGLFLLVLAAGAALLVDLPRLALLGVAALVALVGLFRLIGEGVRRASTELAVTDHRIIYKTGFLSRHTAEMNRNKVESVDVEQSITGRIFGYGTIVLRGIGGTFEPIRNIADPLNFRSHITAA